LLASAQNLAEADSLINLLQFAENEEKKAQLYLRIARRSLPEDAVSYSLLALKIAEKIDNQILMASAYEELSLVQRNYGNIGIAFDYSFKALKIYQERDNTILIAGMNEHIGSHYLYDKNYPKAKSYLNDALAEYEKIKDTLDIILISINLGEAYRVSGDLDSAIIYFDKSLLLEKYLDDELIYAYAIGNLGLVHSAQNKIDTALTELTDATEILDYAASYYKSEIGKIYIDLGRSIEGEQLLLESLGVATDEGLKEQIRDISKILSEYYEESGQIGPALSYRKQYEDYNDSLLNIDNVRKIESLRADYEIDQKQKEVLLLNQINRNQRTIGYLLGGGTLLLFGFSYILYRSNRRIQRSNITLSEQKETIAKREEEKALLLKELNHRVKNNLQMIASLLNLQSSQIHDTEAVQALEAGKLRVEALSLIHQKLYSKDHHTTIAIKEYLEELVMNLTHVYNDNITPRLDIEDIHLNIDIAIPLGLIVNELVINALKYAYHDVKEPELSVTFKTTTSGRVLTVADNGKGLVDKDAHKEDSFGLRLTKSLSEQIDAHLIFINGNGCKWQLTLT